MSLPLYYNETDLFKVNWLTQLSNKFAGFDSKDKFEQNLKKQSDDWHYRHKDIVYTVNSRGYRTQEFSNIDWKESIVVIGCSMVAGIGVADDETITYYLEKMFGRSVINLGVPGAGVDFALFNNFLLRKNYPTPWAVVNVFSNINRLVNFNEEIIEYKGVWSQLDNYWKGHMTSVHNSLLKGILSVQQIQYMWHDTKSHYATWSNDVAQYCDIEKLHFTNTARDLIHCGVESNKQNATVIYSNLKNIA